MEIKAELLWMLVSLVGGTVIESGLMFPDAASYFERAAVEQVAAQKALDNATILAHEQNYRAQPEPVLLSCIAKTPPR